MHNSNVITNIWIVFFDISEHKQILKYELSEYPGYDISEAIFHHFKAQLLNLVDIFHWLYVYVHVCSQP